MKPTHSKYFCFFGTGLIWINKPPSAQKRRVCRTARCRSIPARFSTPYIRQSRGRREIRACFSRTVIKSSTRSNAFSDLQGSEIRC